MPNVQIVDNLALVPLTQSEVATLNLSSLGVVTLTSTSGGSGDMAKAVFATINPAGGFVDKSLIAQTVPYSGLTSLPGGTDLFLRADGTFANPPGQIYSSPTTSTPGLVPALPPSSGFNFYLRGDGSWVSIATLPIGYGQLSGVPASFNPIAHAPTHITGGTDVIPVATTTKTGLLPLLPVSNPGINFLSGNATWTPIPNVSPTAPGLVPAFTGSQTTFWRSDGTYAQPVYAGLAFLPTSFPPSAHHATHVTGGTDIIPNFAIGGATTGLVPGSTGGTVNFLRADGTWAAPTGSGALATSAAAGLIQQLPAATPTLYYARGDNSWQLISGLSIAFTQVTGVPTFAGGSAGLVPNSVGGTVNFLRADGVFAAPAGGALVTTSTSGLVVQLPASSGANFFLRGDDTWQLISSTSIAYTQLTGVPATFAPSAHATTHITGGTDLIPLATVSKTGIVPILPSSNPTFNFLRGDSTWAAIPTASGSIGGLVPTPPNVLNQWFRGDAQFAQIPLVSNISPGLVSAFPGNATTFLNGNANYTTVPYASLSGTPLTFLPTAHATQHITGGTDIIPSFTATASGLAPLSGGGTTTYLRADGTWQTPSGAGDVSHTRQILTINSITGGGDLSADRTHALVGDVASPGNWQMYSTNGSGVRGWNASTVFPQATNLVPGLVPTPPNDSTQFLSGKGTFLTPLNFTATTAGYAPLSGGGTNNFLRADGNWAAPVVPVLATLLAGGTVPQLQPSGINYYLRGDNSWQLIAGITLPFSQITAVPTFSGTLTPGLVPGSDGSASKFLSGSGSFTIIPLASSGAPGLLSVLPASNPTTVFARGDNSWHLLPSTTFVSTPWTIPPVGSPVSGVTVTDTSILKIGMTVLTGTVSATQCLMEITNISGSNLTLNNPGYLINPSSGTSIPGGLMSIVGPSVVSGTSAGFVPAMPSDSTKFLSGTGAWLIPSGSGSGTITTTNSIIGTGSVGSPVQLSNDSASPGAFKFYSTDALGNRGWLPLTYSWETSATFIMPNVLGIVPVTLVTNVGVTVGTTIVVEDNSIPPFQAFLEVTAVNGDGIHITVKNQGYALNSSPGVTFLANAAVTLAGPGVANGTIPGFVPPPPNNTNTFLRGDGQFQQPANVSTSQAGYVPIAPSDITKFLRGDGNWAIPALANLAITNQQGAVPGLLVANQSTSFLRGDNNWISISTMAIGYGQLTGVPTTFNPATHHSTHVSTGSDPIDLFSTTTTTSGLVPGSNNVGSAFFLSATGTWATPPSGPGLATAGSNGLLTGLIASPTLQYLRGDNQWLPIAGLSIGYGQLTSVPGSFTPSAHHGTHLDNGSDPIDVVQGLRTGLVPVLPASVPTTKFLRGDATWTVVPNVSGTNPGLIPAFSGGSTVYWNGAGGYSAVPPVSTGASGLVAALPSSNGTSQWLRGDGNWSNIPFYWTISASFTQPAISGNVPVTFLSTTALVAGMVIVTVDSGNISNYYSVASITNGTTASLTNIGAAGTAATFTVNVGQAKLVSTPVMTSVGAGIVPIPPTDATKYLDGTGHWSTPASSGVQTNRQILTQYSLTGGGDLSADRTLNLVNDTASPGNWQLYGTNGAGTRGWNASSALPVATVSAAGLVPVLSGVSSQFLNGIGSFAAPATLGPASSTQAGIVPILPSASDTYQWLRADNSWQTLPDSNVTTASWTMPAVGFPVSAVTFSSTGNWDAGMTIFFATGSGATCCFMEIQTVTNGTQLVLLNRGYATNPAFNTVIPTSMAFVVSPGVATTGFSGLVPNVPGTTTTFLRGDGSFQSLPVNSASLAGIVPIAPADALKFYSGNSTWTNLPFHTETTATFGVPAAGGSVSGVLILASTWIVIGQTLWVSDGVNQGFFEVTGVASSTSITLKNPAYNGNSVSVTMAIGASVSIQSPGVITATKPGLVPTPPNDSTQVLLGSGAFGTLLYSSLGSPPSTFAPAAHHATHISTGSDPIDVVSSSATGLAPTLSGTNPTDKWLRGDATWVSSPPLAITTSSTFTWPAVAGTVTVTVDSTALMRVGMALYFQNLGVAEVMTIGSGTSVTIRNNGNSGNAGSTAGIAIGTTIYVGGSGSLATPTSSGMIPTPPNNLTTFLSGSATFITPPTATASTPGYVSPPGTTTTFYRGDASFTTLPSAAVATAGVVTPPGGTSSFLRADATWATPTGIGTTVGTAFTWPASGGSLAVNFSSTSEMMVGSAAYFPGFGTAEVTVVTDGTHATIRNNLNKGNLVSGTVTLGSDVYLGTAGALATSTASGVVPIPSGTATDFFGGDAAFHSHSTVALDTLGACTDITTRNATSSLHGLLVKVSGTATDFVGGDNACHAHSTVALDTLGACTDITTRNATSSLHGLLVKVSGTSTDFVGGDNACHAHTTVPIDTLGAATDITTLNCSSSAHGLMPKADGTATHFYSSDGTQKVIPAATATVTGLVPTPPNNTYQYIRGDATWVTPPLTTVTTAGFTQVALGVNTASIAVESSAWMSAGMMLIVGTGSTWNYMTVVSKADSTHVVLTNVQGSTVSGTIASGAIIHEGGAPIATSTASGVVPIPSGTATDFLGGDAAFHAHSTVALDTLGACTDITTRNATSSLHGLLVKVSGTATDFVGGDNACHAHTTVPIDTLGSSTDITTLNSSTSAHGLLKKLDNTVTHYMDGTGNWSTPGVTSTTTNGTFTIPGSGSTVVVTIVSCTWPIVGQKIYIHDSGTNAMYGTITVVGSATSITVLNTGDTGNAVSGTMATAAGVQLVDYQSLVWDKFTPGDNDPPATLYATFDVINNISTLGFNDSATWTAVFKRVLPQYAALGSGIIVRIKWASVAATSGAAVFGAAFERMSLTINSDHFGTQVTATTTTSGTAGVISETAITIPYANMGSAVSGDPYRLQIQRIGANGSDTLTGNAEVLFVTVESGAF